jgi:hypothetical protein
MRHSVDGRRHRAKPRNLRRNVPSGLVREAFRANAALKDRNFDVVAIGSCRNNTNVRAVSDVDLAVVLRSAIWYELPTDGSLTREMLEITDAKYTLAEFRNDVSRALRERFGARDFDPGKITLTVDESSARLGADVTPYLVYRRYTGRRLTDGSWESHAGIETRPADAPTRRIIQWPEQHYVSGVAKNDATGRRYKRVVRILKSLRNHVAEQGAPQAKGLATTTKSCLIEHAVFNVPNDQFNQTDGSYYNDVRGVISFLWNAAREPTRAGAFLEVSKMQRLLRDGEPWSAKSLEDFALVAWQHVGFPK